jgi:phenylpropionate dioxygenase-like ring-hydroxylating dioxygenase large terminal subunit
MAKKQFLKIPYGGYYREPIPAETPDLTHVEKGSRAGELLRRYWQPVCLSEEVGELPKRERMFGEDLVVFRTTENKIAIVDRHCPHRGTSLEFGLCEKDGIRCCYHGWLIACDGTILETPGDPPGSTLKDRLVHGAYPAMEYKGLIFGYFGPPEQIPDFPIYDSYEWDGDLMRPYSLHYPCNWLQVHENVMDPAHAVFLHTRVTYSHFADAWGELPEMDFIETPTGMIYVTSRRWNDNVWVRSNDILLPNLAQVGHVWEDGQQDLKEFGRVGITRWTSPVDNENCKVIGWRHFHPEVNSRGIGNPDQCGVEMVDFVGQDGKRSYDERQRIPGDFDAQVSQRPIARHALEHLTYCDKGVVMLRRMLLREIKRLEASEPLNASPLRSQGKIPTYCHDTVVRVPGNPQLDDDALVRKVGADLTKIIVEGDYHATDDRIEHVRLRIRNYVEQLNVQAAE